MIGGLAARLHTLRGRRHAALRRALRSRQGFHRRSRPRERDAGHRGGGPLWPSTGIDPLEITGRGRSKPLVTALQGRVFTIGIELALASDIRLCSDDATFAQLEIARGIFPFGGATFRAPAQLGWGNAMRFLLTAEPFGGVEALRIGLVQEVTPARSFSSGRSPSRSASRPGAARRARHACLGPQGPPRRRRGGGEGPSRAAGADPQERRRARGRAIVRREARRPVHWQVTLQAAGARYFFFLGRAPLRASIRRSREGGS